MDWKWFADQWGHLIANHYEGLMILGTSLLGSLVGLRKEEKISFWLGIVVVVTSASTSIFLAKLAEYYLQLPSVATLALCYFLGTVGNRITLSFVKGVGVFLADPLGTLKYIGKVIIELIKIKRGGN